MENWLGMSVQAQCTTPRPEQLKTIPHRNNCSDSTLTAPKTQKEMRGQIEWALQQVVEQPIKMLKREVREQTLEENNTTSFVAGKNKVGTDSFSPSTYRFPGYDL